MARYRIFLLTLLTALAIVSATAACGGGDDDDGGDGGGGEQPAATSTDGGQDTATPTDGSSDGGSSNDGDGDSSDDGGDDNGGGDSTAGLAKIKAAAAKLEQQAFHIVFEMQAQGIDGTFTLTSEPPNSALGMDGVFDGSAGSYRIITLDDFLYFCSDSDGEQGCIKMKATQSAPMQLPSVIDASDIATGVANTPGMEVKQVGGETIAGIGADCYEFKGPNEEGKVCIGDDMMLLYEGTYEGETVSMRASEYTGEAGKIEITVPDWPITDLSSLGN